MENDKYSKWHHYFKIDKEILSIPRGAISKKELFAYIQHCRAMNPTKNEGCSLAGASNAKETLGLDNAAYKKAEKLLIEKHFIKERPEVKTGHLKTIAIEVLPFPTYDVNTSTFSPNTTTDHQDRKNNPTQYINIPSMVVDAEILKGLSLQATFALILLYRELSVKNYQGINYHFVHMYNSKSSSGIVPYKNFVFGNEYNERIRGKACMEVISPDSMAIDPSINFIHGNLQNAINELRAVNVGENLFLESYPILIEQDPEDTDIIEIVNRIHKGVVQIYNDAEAGNKYLLSEINNNQKVIWILIPHNDFRIVNDELEQYNREQRNLELNQLALYDYNLE